MVVVDGDDLRGLLPNPGYDRVGRERNIDRAQAIAAFLNRHVANWVVVALVSPYREQRERFKAAHDVVEVFVHTTEMRGKEDFHVDDYEQPVDGFLDCDTTNEKPACSVRRLRGALATAAQRSRMAAG